MIKINKTATKIKCYWKSGETGWYLSDFTGPVYKDKYGYWLRTPTGFTGVNKSNFIN